MKQPETSRELTLKEYVEKLPEIHFARKEYNKLIEKTALIDNDLLTIIVSIRPAIEVLKTMCKVLKLNLGAEKAEEMLAWIDEALSGQRETVASPGTIRKT